MSNEIDTSHFDLSKVTDFTYMFYDLNSDSVVYVKNEEDKNKLINGNAFRDGWVYNIEIKN